MHKKYGVFFIKTYNYWIKCIKIWGVLLKKTHFYVNPDLIFYMQKILINVKSMQAFFYY